MNKLRIELERKIARAFVKQALAAGFRIEIDNGEERTGPLDTVSSVLGKMFQTDEDWVYLKHKTIDWMLTDGAGWVRFVYGNDGWDVISDYTTNLEGLMGEANKISEKYSDYGRKQI